MSSLVLALLGFLAITSEFAIVSAADVHYTFVAKPRIGDTYSPDCQNTKDSGRWLFLVNDMLPGPTIEATEGDTIFIHVINEHPSTEIALHWHGLWATGNPWSDGPAGITQCGLGPKQEQTYEILAYPAGTHYWHAHLAYNLADGQAGPIVVKPKEVESFTYDEEQIVMFQDFYIKTGQAQAIGLLNLPFVWIGNPDTILVNGKGVASKCAPDGALHNDTTRCLATCSDPLALYETFKWQAGLTYRLRFISSNQLPGMNIAITGHTMTVVVVEGTEIEPYVVSNLDISPGQRYDVLVTLDQAAGNYWLEASVRGRSIPTLFAQAIINYNTVEADLPTDKPSHPAWDDQSIYQEDSMFALNINDHPEQLPALQGDDVARYVLVGTQNFKYKDGERSQLVWAINNITTVTPAEPIIGQAYKTAQASGWPASIPNTIEMPQEPPFTWDYNASVYDPGGPGEEVGTQGVAVASFTEGQVVEFVLQNTRALNFAAELHPWHLHGHAFWQVGRGEGTWTPADITDYNLINPVLRDTVSLWGGNWVAIRFVANNPGVWNFHCHILSHLIMGMGFALVVSPDQMGKPSDSVKFCTADSLEQNVPSPKPTFKPTTMPAPIVTSPAPVLSTPSSPPTKKPKKNDSKKENSKE
jgi:FtsP/CotA-like multicopper oxidase with cupredoxin domain